MNIKKLSDYKGDEAIELWADLIDPIARIIADDEIAKVYKTQPKIVVAKEILKRHKSEATEILTRIDPAPLNGLNIITRIIALLVDIETADETKGFFESAGQAMTASESTGSATENTEGAEK